MTADLRDFSHRIADALRTLERVEERDQIEILADLSLTSDDVIRVRLTDTEAVDSTLSLERASHVVARTYDLILAAACAATEPRLCYPSRKPQKATDYMRNVRMGQTERGSFVITALSRVAPALQFAEEADALGIPEPFERRVTEKLASALDAASSAAAHAITSGDLSRFEAAVDRGVSANLCEAIAGMEASEEHWHDVEVRISWARSRPARRSLPARFLITADMAPVFQETARVLRSKSPRDDFELSGPVIRLNRGPEDSNGEVTVAGLVDEATRSVGILLSGDDYKLAVRAHQDRLPLSATGALQKQGRRYILSNPTSIRLLPVEE